MKATLSRYWPIFAALVVLALAGWKGQVPPVDTRGVTPVISSYAFLGVSGTVTMYVSYTNLAGQEVQDGTAITIPVANGSNAPVTFTVPADATGVNFRTTGSVYWQAAASHTTMTTNYANCMVFLTESEAHHLGR